jgi:enoyl-CoA hydratase
VMAADFREGVRATLVEKGTTPHWQPAALAGVNDAAIASYFASLGAGELTLPG